MPWPREGKTSRLFFFFFRPYFPPRQEDGKQEECWKNGMAEPKQSAENGEIHQIFVFL